MCTKPFLTLSEQVALSVEQWKKLDGETVSVTGMLVKAGGKTYVQTEVTCG